MASTPSGTDPFATLRPSQLALLRLVCWVACADGDFAEEERQFLAKLTGRLLAASTAEAVDQAVAALALEGEADVAVLVGQLEYGDQRQLLVKLAFQMACSNQRAQDDAAINRQEKQAYRQLIAALALPEQEVEEAEWAAQEELRQADSLLERLSRTLLGFGAWPSQDAFEMPIAHWL